MIILGPPTGWQPSRITRFGSFNPKGKEKAFSRLIISNQYKDSLIYEAVEVSFVFAFEPPKTTSKKIRQKMILGEILHAKKPDTSNCIKFYEDCLKGIVICDDNQVVQIRARKIYAEKAETKIFITKLGEDYAAKNR